MTILPLHLSLFADWRKIQFNLIPVMLFDAINKSKWYLFVCNVDLWEIMNFTDIYNPESEFISNFRFLRSWSLAECGSKFVYRDDGHQIDWHNQMHNFTSKPSESVQG